MLLRAFGNLGNLKLSMPRTNPTISLIDSLSPFLENVTSYASFFLKIPKLYFNPHFQLMFTIHSSLRKLKPLDVNSVLPYLLILTSLCSLHLAKTKLSIRTIFFIALSPYQSFYFWITSINLHLAFPYLQKAQDFKCMFKKK